MRHAKTVLFFSVIGIFVLTAIVTLLGVAGVLPIQSEYLKGLYGALLLELVAAVIGFFKTIKLNEPEPPPIPDLTGDWTYLCTAHDKDYQHGGGCTFETSRTSYGLELRVLGQRLWYQEAQGERKKITWNWHSSWGMITGENKIKFEYSVEQKEGSIKGYVWADIVVDHGKPVELKGNFYQLPPYNPLFGNLEFHRK